MALEHRKVDISRLIVCRLIALAQYWRLGLFGLSSRLFFLIDSFLVWLACWSVAPTGGVIRPVYTPACRLYHIWAWLSKMAAIIVEQLSVCTAFFGSEYCTQIGWHIFINGSSQIQFQGPDIARMAMDRQKGPLTAKQSSPPIGLD